MGILDSKANPTHSIVILVYVCDLITTGYRNSKVMDDLVGIGSNWWCRKCVCQDANEPNKTKIKLTRATQRKNTNYETHEEMAKSGAMG